MDKTRIVELFIDEEYVEAGIEAISLVSKPAHEETWHAFNKEDEYSPYKVVPEDFCNTLPSLQSLGEPYSQLINDGWEVVKVEKMTPQKINEITNRNQKFITSNPNENSELDTDEYRVRFKYVGPQDERNRQFCADMMSQNRVYRIEDIDQLTAQVANSEFGYYSIFLWRGSFNCRHVWVRLLYKRTGTIINNASSRIGVTGVEGLGPELQPNTVPQDQRGTVAPRQGRFVNEPFKPKKIEDKFSSMPVTQADFADAISDYPEAVKNAAKRAVDYAEKNGWGSCGTDVGKQRASQLAKGENISIDTLKRMYSYLSRHKSDLTSSKSYEDGCGKLMYDSWGGEAALKWAETKLEQIKKEKMVFSFDEEKRIVVGAAMVPNKMIHRYDDLGNLYYVFFSKKSIKMMADKFLKEKRTDETSVEHNGVKLGSDKVFITESWVSEDPVLDKSHFYGFELPAGTWYVAMKVNDDKVWKMIKEKSLTGFSVEGLFAEKGFFAKEDKQINQIRKLLKSIKDDQ